MQKKILIGIDSDTDKSGWAIYELEKNSLTLECLPNSEIFWGIKRIIDYIGKESVLVRVEAGYLNKSNWHASAASKIYESTKGSHKTKLNTSLSYAAKIGSNTGRNHQVSYMLVDLIKSLGCEVQEIRPSQTKMNGETFNNLTGYVGRTNQEKRDAAALILEFICKK